MLYHMAFKHQLLKQPNKACSRPPCLGDFSFQYNAQRRLGSYCHPRGRRLTLTVGRVLCAKPSRSRMALDGAFTKERGAATKERIEREMKARCATWFRVARSQPRVVRALVILYVIPISVWRISPWYEGSWC